MPRTRKHPFAKPAEAEDKGEPAADTLIRWAASFPYRTYPLTNDSGVTPASKVYDVPAIRLAEQVAQGIGQLLREGYVLELGASKRTFPDRPDAVQTLCFTKVRRKSGDEAIAIIETPTL